MGPFCAPAIALLPTILFFLRPSTIWTGRNVPRDGPTSRIRPGNCQHRRLLPEKSGALVLGVSWESTATGVLKARFLLERLYLSAGHPESGHFRAGTLRRHAAEAYLRTFTSNTLPN